MPGRGAALPQQRHGEPLKRAVRRLIGHELLGENSFPTAVLASFPPQEAVTDRPGPSGRKLPLTHRHREEAQPTTRSCVREDALSARCKSLSCEVTAHVAKGNCVVARRGGEQPAANGQPVGERTRFGGVSWRARDCMAKPGPEGLTGRAEVTVKATTGGHGVVGDGMSGRQSGVSGETWRSCARSPGVRALIVPLRLRSREVRLAKPDRGKVGRKVDA